MTRGLGFTTLVSDRHIHGVTITFHDDGKVTSAWEGYAGGKKAKTATFVMTRRP